MIRFIVLSVVIIATGLALAFTTELAPESTVSHAQFLGIPIVSRGETEFAWLSVGVGTGVLVLGMGAGIVVYGYAGAGLLFATGQACCGLIVLGQGAFGLVLALGQMGIGIVCAGQVVVGGLGWAQGRFAFDGRAFILSLRDDLNDTLRFGG